MASIASDPLSVRVEWHLGRIEVVTIVLALLVCGLVLGLSVHRADGPHTGSLTPAATSTSP